MNVSRRRRLGGLFGGALVLIAVWAIALVGHPLVETPILVIQVLLLGLAGVFDIIAATDTRLTARWIWYRWSGVGHILLGLSLPLGFVGTDSGLVLVIVTGIGGLSLARWGLISPCSTASTHAKTNSLGTVPDANGHANRWPARSRYGHQSRWSVEYLLDMLDRG